MEATHESGDITQEEAAAFIGNNNSFYWDKWKAHSKGVLKGWNWAAAFFGVEWMAYRKMYVEAVIALAIVSSISFLLALFSLESIGDFWGDTLRITIGVVGNALYRKKALRVLREIDSQSDDSQRLDTLSRKGGVSKLSVVVIIFLEIVCFGLPWLV